MVSCPHILWWYSVHVLWPEMVTTVLQQLYIITILYFPLVKMSVIHHNEVTLWIVEHKEKHLIPSVKYSMELRCLFKPLLKINDIIIHNYETSVALLLEFKWNCFTILCLHWFSLTFFFTQNCPVFLEIAVNASQNVMISHKWFAKVAIFSVAHISTVPPLCRLTADNCW